MPGIPQKQSSQPPSTPIYPPTTFLWDNSSVGEATVGSQACDAHVETQSSQTQPTVPRSGPFPPNSTYYSITTQFPGSRIIKKLLFKLKK